jgi:hypothetical protein
VSLSLSKSTALKYENQEIAIEIDLAFKEITSIKALGLEIQSRESLLALKKLAGAFMRSAQEIKRYHENPYNDGRLIKIHYLLSLLRN